MIPRLRLLGGVGIELDNGLSLRRVAQRSRLALLALLARADRHAMTRDKLVAMLWPEHPDERARHLLRQAVHVIRKELGRDALVSVGDDLRLDPASLEIDVVQFEEAIRGGMHEEAAALYRGCFLDGFHLKDALEFERWADAERERLAADYARALEALARAAETRGDAAAAAGWWRRLAEHDPWSSRTAFRLMQSFVAAGDPAAALRHADHHASILSEELGTTPDHAVLDLATRLRAMPTPGGATTLKSTDPETPVAASVAGLLRVRRSRRRSRTIAGAALVAAIILVTGGLRIAIGRGGARASGTVDRVAVLPFVVRGGEDLAYLSEGMADLLSVRLDVPDEVRTVDPRAVVGLLRETPAATRDPAAAASLARDLRASTFVLGTVVAAGDRIEIEASLYGPGDRRRVVSSVTATETGLPEAIDRLARELLAGRYGRPADRLTRTAALTTSSLPALKAYLAGERALREGRFEVAVQEFRRATAFDPAFALAHYRLSVAANWDGDAPLVRSSLEDARRLEDRLPERARLLLEARHAAFVGLDFFRSERILRDLVARYPDDVEGLYELADYHFHNAVEWGLDPADVRRDFARVLTLEPDHEEAILHMARLAALEDRHAAFDSLVTRGLEVQPEGEYAVELRALRAFELGDPVERERAIADFNRLDDETLGRLVVRIPAFTSEMTTTRPLYELLTARSRPAWLQALGHIGLAHLDVANGRLRAARGHLVQAEQLAPQDAAFSRAILAVTWGLPVSFGELDRARRELNEARINQVSADEPSHDFLLLGGLLAAREGDIDGARSYVASIEESNPVDRSGSGAPALVRAAIEWRRGRPEAALRELGDGESTRAVEHYGLESYLRAEILRALGRDREALDWYTVQPATDLFSPLSLAPSLLHRAEIHARLGEHREAVRCYSRFVALWKDADPELQPLVAHARRELARLTSG